MPCASSSVNVAERSTVQLSAGNCAVREICATCAPDSTSAAYPCGAREELLDPTPQCGVDQFHEFKDVPFVTRLESQLRRTGN